MPESVLLIIAAAGAVLNSGQGMRLASRLGGLELSMARLAGRVDTLETTMAAVLSALVARQRG